MQSQGSPKEQSFAQKSNPSGGLRSDPSKKSLVSNGRIQTFAGGPFASKRSIVKEVEEDESEEEVKPVQEPMDEEEGGEEEQ